MRTGVIEWAVKSRTLPGETQCGDRCVVIDTWGGVLTAVIDGLGHGKEAARAAGRAVEIIEDNSSRTFSSLLQQCHSALRDTRGVVMSLAFLDKQRTMTWMGIGDVEGRLIYRQVRYAEKSESLLLRTGVVGGVEQLPSLYTRGASLMRGDVLILATDGIKRNFDEHVNVAEEPKQIARDIITRYSKGNDDALVFVGKYIG